MHQTQAEGPRVGRGHAGTPGLHPWPGARGEELQAPSGVAVGAGAALMQPALVCGATRTRLHAGSHGREAERPGVGAARLGSPQPPRQREPGPRALPCRLSAQPALTCSVSPSGVTPQCSSFGRTRQRRLSLPGECRAALCPQATCSRPLGPGGPVTETPPPEAPPPR